MKRQDMENLKLAEIEIDSLRRQIKQLDEERVFIQSAAFGTISKSGNVDDGMHRTIVYLERSQKLREKLSEKLQKLMTDEDEAYAFLDTVEDAEMRQILFMRCLEFKTWREIGVHLIMDRRTAARKYENFWVKNESCPQCPSKMQYNT